MRLNRQTWRGLWANLFRHCTFGEGLLGDPLPGMEHRLEFPFDLSRRL